VDQSLVDANAVCACGRLPTHSDRHLDRPARVHEVIWYIMQFLKALREPIRRGEITTTIRLWQRPHVKVGGRYALPPGEIIVTKLFEISLSDVTPQLARDSGFAGIADLLKVAKHGAGRRVFFIEFQYQARRSPIVKGKTS